MSKRFHVILYKGFMWRWSGRTAVMVAGIVAAVLLLGGGSYALFWGGGSGPASSVNSINLSKGLVGHWKLDGNMKDSTPYHNDGAASTIRVVQGPIEAETGNKNSISASWSVATTAGDTLVAVVTINNGYSTPTAPAGWTLRQGVSGWGTSVYEIVNASARSGTETFSFSGGNDATIWLVELSGVSLSASDDATTAYSGNNAPMTLGPAIMGGNAGIVFAAIDTNDGRCSGPGNIAPSGWTQASGGYRARLGYRLVNGGQSVSALFNTGCQWNGVIFSFNAAMAPGITPTTDRMGKANGAYNFSGTHYGISTLLVQTNVSAYTESAWVKFTDDSKNSTIIQDRGSGAGQSLTLALNTNNSGCPAIGSVSYALDSTSRYIGVYTNSRYDDGLWHHVTGVWSGTSGAAVTPSQFAVYVDGAPAITSTCNIGSANAPLSGSGGTVIGYHQTWNGKYTGVLGDVRIYNRAITAAEVSALYHSYNDPMNLANGENGLVGWWKMDNNVKDSSPNRTVCTPPTSSPSYGPDRNGSANGAMSPPKLGLDCGQPTALRVTTATLSAWVYPTSWNSSGNGIESYGGTLQFFFGSSGNLQLNIHDSLNQNHSFISPSTYALNQWYHVAATYDGSTVVLYVNGSPVLSTSYTGGIGTNHYGDSGNDFLLGEFNSASTTRNFKGSLDDVRIYNRALSPQEITNMYGSYNSQLDMGGDGQANGINLQSGLVGYWDMNGNAKDSTPYRDNGTIVGSGTWTADRKGRSNSAYKSAGNSGISIADESQIDITTGSYSAWFIANSTPSYRGMVFQRSVSTDIIYLFSNNEICFSGGAIVCSTGSVLDGRWHLVTVTRVSNGQLSLYLDGVLQQSVTVGAIAAQGGTLCIGDGSTVTTPCGNGVSPSFPGYIDDFRIYNRVLNAAEVQTLYNEYR